MLIGDGDLPRYLRSWEKRFAFEWFEQERLPYLCMRALRDGPDRPLGEALDAVLQELAAAAPLASVVVDMRFAYGGDYTIVLPFFTQLEQYLHADAPIYLLTSHATFSAGILAAAIVRHICGERVVHVGERVGDRERFWAQKFTYRLPNSQLRVHYSLQLHDVADGCDDPSICFPHETSPGMAVGPLVPDIHVPLRFEDYAVGRDAVMDTIRAREGSHRERQ